MKGTGADLLCKLCISSGGSCCGGCKQLKPRSGCQQRNTSCTAWLCGFLKYLLYEADLLENRTSFWKQVPGQDFREDQTPPYFAIRKQLKIGNLRFLRIWKHSPEKKAAIANHIQFLTKDFHRFHQAIALYRQTLCLEPL
jgi:hypothetical protein